MISTKFKPGQRVYYKNNIGHKSYGTVVSPTEAAKWFRVYGNILPAVDMPAVVAKWDVFTSNPVCYMPEGKVFSDELTLDLSKPVECNGQPVRILCTDNPGFYPIVGSFPDGFLGKWNRKGEHSLMADKNLVNSPEKPAEFTFTFCLQKNRRGKISLVPEDTYSVNRGHVTLVGKTTVTIKEGDGL